jgi:creatinine amidohydrolase
MEQHGLHLPVNTDIATAWHIAVSAAQMLEDVPIVVAPPVWSGLSPHHMKYGGTISLRLETFAGLIGDICSSIVAHGFGAIVLLNGHGGNQGLLEGLALDLRHRLKMPVLAITYWDLIPDEMEAVREGRGKGIGHSGEMETSIQLFLQRDLVAADQLELVPGVTDDPAWGRPEKGERLMKAAAERLAKRLRALISELEPAG